MCQKTEYFLLPLIPAWGYKYNPGMTGWKFWGLNLSHISEQAPETLISVQQPSRNWIMPFKWVSLEIGPLPVEPSDENAALVNRYITSSYGNQRTTS